MKVCLSQSSNLSGLGTAEVLASSNSGHGQVRYVLWFYSESARVQWTLKVCVSNRLWNNPRTNYNEAGQLNYVS